MTENNTTSKPYIVKNADGVEYLLPYYPATFRAFLDDKDAWMLYSKYDVKAGTALPLFPKNKYIILDLVKFLKLRKGVNSREVFWLRLISRGPLEVPESED